MKEESTTANKRNAHVGKNVPVVIGLLLFSLYLYSGLDLNTVDIKGRGGAPAASPNSNGDCNGHCTTEAEAEALRLEVQGWKNRAVTSETNAKIAIEKLEKEHETNAKIALERLEQENKTNAKTAREKLEYEHETNAKIAAERLKYEQEHEHEHELAMERLNDEHKIELEFAPKPSKEFKYAIVHLLSGFNDDYVVALLSSAHRLRNFHAKLSGFPCQLDLVVMVTESADLSGFDHPFIRFVTFDDKYILKPLDGKQFWRATMLKLASAGLEEYDKVLFLDLDTVVYKELASILMETTPPAMVPWQQYPDMDYNSGLQILRPNKTMLADMVETMSHLMNSSDVVLEELRQRSTAESIKANPTAGSTNVNTNVKQVSNFRGDQEFLFAFYDIIPETSRKYGPIRALPFRYNARSGSLRPATNALLQGKKIASEFSTSLLHLYGGFGHDGEGHQLTEAEDETNGLFGLVVVHFTTDKPWTTAICNGISNSDEVINNSAMTPRERCPEILHQMTFWEGAFAAIKEAAMDSRYGPRWTSNSIRNMLDGGKDGKCFFEICLRPEREALYQILTNMTDQAVVAPTTYIPLILPP